MKNKQLLDKIMKDKKVFLHLRMNGNFLGIAIKQKRPKNKEEWLKYVVEWKMNNKAFLTTYSILNNFCKGRIKDREIIAYLDNMVINDTWKGYHNELKVENYLIERGFIVEPASGNDDKKGVDMWIKKTIFDSKKAISVKSGGFNFNDNGKGIRHIKKQAKKLKKDILIVRVNDDDTFTLFDIKA